MKDAMNQQEINKELEKLNIFRPVAIGSSILLAIAGVIGHYYSVKYALFLTPIGVFDCIFLGIILNNAEARLKHKLEKQNGEFKRY